MKRPVRYSYIQPKLYAERARLLTPEKYKELAECTSLSSFKSALLDTVYGKALAAVPDDQLEIEKAIHGVYAETLTRVVRGSSYKLVEFGMSLVLSYEYENLKLVIRALASGVPIEEVKKYLYVKAEELLGRRHVLARLLAARSVSEAARVAAHVGLVRRESLAILRGAVRSAEEEGNTLPLEVLLDFEWIARVAMSLRKLGKDEYRVGSHVLAPVTDYRVALAIERCWSEKASEALEVARRVGLCLEANLRRLLHDPSRAVQAFRDSLGLPEAGEHAVRREALRRAMKAYREMFTVGPLTGLAVMKLNEILNLVALSRGTDLGLRPQEKLSLVVLPELREPSP